MFVFILGMVLVVLVKVTSGEETEANAEEKRSWDRPSHAALLALRKVSVMADPPFDIGGRLHGVDVLNLICTQER